MGLVTEMLYFPLPSLRKSLRRTICKRKSARSSEPLPRVNIAAPIGAINVPPCLVRVEEGMYVVYIRAYSVLCLVHTSGESQKDLAQIEDLR